MSKIQLISDLHVEWFSNCWDTKELDRILSNILHKDSKNTILILAGDIGSNLLASSGLRSLKYVIDFFSHNWTQVLYVPGNHEYYFGDLFSVNEVLRREIQNKYKNVKVLINEDIKIEQLHFVGSTLWFPHKATNPLHFGRMRDSSLIKDSLEMLEKLGEDSYNFILNNAKEDSIVITHHLPSFQSVPEIYKTNKINNFFVNEKCENLIENLKPRIWVHGHTHRSCSYKLFKTHIVCNPFGYYATDDMNIEGFVDNLFIKV